MRKLLIVSTLFFVGNYCVAQESNTLLDGLGYKVEMQGTLSDGDNNPLWLNANKHGLSSLKNTNGYLRASLERPLALDNEKQWGVGYGIDVAAAYRFTSTVVVQQAFAELRWLKGVLTVGSKEYPMELKDAQLSSGSQALGINARPVPQVRLALTDYWELPFTKGWVSLKGHIAYGMMTDDRWQKDFTQLQSKYTEKAMYHSKAGYLKIGNAHRFHPVSLELGLEMASLFGGDTYTPDGAGGMIHVVNQKGLASMLNAFLPRGGESFETVYRNAEGDVLGSWVARLNLDYDSWYLGIYADHFFEDHSSMFFLDYDGYGTDSNWNKKEKWKFVLYDLKDIMLGAELKLKEASWMNHLVFEYLYTKYQSGPIYHDRNKRYPDHLGGQDNYYNHYIHAGWQHWGQVIGNPLYLSPLYNDDGEIQVKNNRFYAFHLGMGGEPAEALKYRLLATYQKGFGTYKLPYYEPKESVSLLAEATYSFSEAAPLGGWTVKLGLAADFGELRGNNWGAQFTLINKGLLNLLGKKKK